MDGIQLTNILMIQHGDLQVLILLLKKIKRTLEIKELMKKSMDLLPTTDQFFHNHGEESKRHTQSMVSRTQNSNGSINQLPLHNKRREILVIKELMRKSTVLLLTTDQFFHNHGEESKKLTHKMDSKTQNSSGSINQLLLLNKKRKISATKESMRKFMDLPPMTDLFSHNHGEESKKLTHKMGSKTQLSSGLINQLPLHKLNSSHATDSMVSTVKFQ